MLNFCYYIAVFPRKTSGQRCSGGCISRISVLRSFPRSIRFPTFTIRPRITRMARIFSCRGSRVGCDRLSAIKSADGRIRRGEHQTLDIKLRSRGFTLIELLVVMAIILILMVLLAPAFTSIKSAGDVTGAAYTIKGVLDMARTYAKANNTYTWVGFYEEDVSLATPASPGSG